MFCAQDRQTGQQPGRVIEALTKAGQDFERLDPDAPPLELAFFGGTFTALGQEDLQACLAFTSYWIDRGIVRTARCSTRPDALSEPILDQLKQAGFSTVELGIQSFDLTALAVSRRGYAPADAVNGCRMVRAAGMDLVIQLMPGMPGSSPESFRADVEKAVREAPSAVRLYPCLVLRGTPLEQIWRDGSFIPWTMEQTVSYLAEASLTLWGLGIPIIRLGLAHEPGLAESILAGPHHPSLGDLVKGRALFLYLKQHLRQSGLGYDTVPDQIAPDGAFPDGPGAKSTAGPSTCGLAVSSPSDSPVSGSPGPDSPGPHSRAQPPILYVPRHWQGTFWGAGRSLEPCYAAIGLPRYNVRWWDQDGFALTQDCDSPGSVVT